MPSVSERQHRAMEAVAHGHSTLGIPQSVGKEFVAHDSAAAAGVLCTIPDGRVLLLKRSAAEANYPGHWDLPGGMVNAGEDPARGAVRELEEETGHRASGQLEPAGESPLLGSGEGTYSTFKLQVPEAFEPKLSGEHDDYAWAHPMDLPRPLHPGLQGLSGQLSLGQDEAPHQVALDRGSVRRKDVDGHLHVERTPISKANICPYYGREIPGGEGLGLDPNRLYRLLRHPDELKRAANTFAGKPLLLDHQVLSADEHPHKRTVGSVGDDVRWEPPYLTAPLTVWDRRAIDGIEGGNQKQLSAAYRYRADMTPGTYQGQPYDGVMRDLIANHVALVSEGRAGPDVVVGDAAPRPQSFKGMFFMSKPRSFADMFALDADWDEDKHPRGEGGKFGKGDGASAKASANKYGNSDRMEAHAQWAAHKFHSQKSAEHRDAASKRGLDPEVRQRHKEAARQHFDASRLHAQNGADFEKGVSSQARKDAAEKAHQTGAEALKTSDKLKLDLMSPEDRAKEEKRRADQKKANVAAAYWMTGFGKPAQDSKPSPARAGAGRARNPGTQADTKRKEAPMAKDKMSKTATLVQGALMATLAPKLAQDAKVDLRPILKGLTSKNFGERVDSIVSGVTREVKGRLAQDADVGDLASLLDALKEVPVEEDEDLEPMGEKDLEPRGLDDEGADLGAPEAGEGNTEVAGKGGEEGTDPLDQVRKLLAGKLTPEEINRIDKILDSLLGVKDAPIDEEAGGAPAMDQDKEKDMITKQAMDTAINAAVKAERQAAREVEAAREHVRPRVGKIALACDTAADVYRSALNMLGVDVKGVHPSAFKAIFDAQPKARAGESLTPTIAADSKVVSGFAERHPNAARVQHA